MNSATYFFHDHAMVVIVLIVSFVGFMMGSLFFNKFINRFLLENQNIECRNWDMIIHFSGHFDLYLIMLVQSFDYLNCDNILYMEKGSTGRGDLVGIPAWVSFGSPVGISVAILGVKLVS